MPSYRFKTPGFTKHEPHTDQLTLNRSTTIAFCKSITFSFQRYSLLPLEWLFSIFPSSFPLRKHGCHTKKKWTHRQIELKWSPRVIKMEMYDEEWKLHFKMHTQELNEKFESILNWIFFIIIFFICQIIITFVKHINN